MLHAIASAFIGVALFISSLFGVVPAHVQAPAVEQSLGAALPSGTAVFETSLQSRISSTDTSMTLVANSVRGGSSLSGFQCFTVDEGRTDAEYICGTISGTSVTGLTRGINPSTGTTTNSALKFAHRVGSDVKITDFPVLQILRNQAAGIDTYSNVLTYASGVTPAATGDLTDKEYVDSLAFNGAGVIDASSIAKGVVELATGAEAAASTASGSSGTLALPASGATSTYNSATAANRVVVTGVTGKIDNNFIGTSTGLFANSTMTGTTTLAGFNATATTSSIGAFPAWQIGKQFQIITTTGTSSFAVPQGITKVQVELCGAGAAGGDAGSNPSAGSGGGAGGYAMKMVDVSGTSSIQAFVGTGGGSTGAAGTWSTFGTNGFYMSATGGNSQTGGTATGGDINIGGQVGFTAPSTAIAAPGGSSAFGWGGGWASNTTGSNGTGYCSGGGGGQDGGSQRSGGVGANGIVIVRW
jgi:hypothetical protein